MIEHSGSKPVDNKPKYPRYTNVEKFGVLADTVSIASSVELGSLVKKITAEALANKRKQKQANKWNDLKDKALARAQDLKSRGSEKILVGMGTAQNKHGEAETRLYFVFLGNEANPLYVTGVPLSVIPKIDNYRQTRGDLQMDDIVEYLPKVHKKK